MAAQRPAKLRQHQDTGTRLKRRNFCHSLSRRNWRALEQRGGLSEGMVGMARWGRQREQGDVVDSSLMKSLWDKGKTLVSDGSLRRRVIGCDEIEQHTEKKTLGAANSHESDCCGGQEATSKGRGGREEEGLGVANTWKKSDSTMAYQE